MEQAKMIHIRRSPVDRRAPVDRRIHKTSNRYPGTEERTIHPDRRKGWEDRYGWERVSKWSSSPVYPDVP